MARNGTSIQKGLPTKRSLMQTIVRIAWQARYIFLVLLEYASPASCSIVIKSRTSVWDGTVIQQISVHSIKSSEDKTSTKLQLQTGSLKQDVQTYSNNSWSSRHLVQLWVSSGWLYWVNEQEHAEIIIPRSNIHIKTHIAECRGVCTQMGAAETGVVSSFLSASD